nr:hypothetical protein [uncultured Merdimonas sp.]
MRYTEYHAGVAVIKDKALLPRAMEKPAKIEDMGDIPQICCDECKIAELFGLLVDDEQNYETLEG